MDIALQRLQIRTPVTPVTQEVQPSASAPALPSRQYFIALAHLTFSAIVVFSLIRHFSLSAPPQLKILISLSLLLVTDWTRRSQPE